jgi:hypothetical protein
MGRRLGCFRSDRVPFPSESTHPFGRCQRCKDNDEKDQWRAIVSPAVDENGCVSLRFSQLADFEKKLNERFMIVGHTMIRPRFILYLIDESFLMGLLIDHDEFTIDQLVFFSLSTTTNSKTTVGETLGDIRPILMAFHSTTEIGIRTVRGMSETTRDHDLSNKVVNIRINVHSCSQIICQNASQVSGNGPCVAM